MSGQQTKITQITDYQELLAAWQQEREWQLARAAAERWLVYLCRRLPLYLAAGLMPFGLMLAFSLMDGVKPADLLATQVTFKQCLQTQTINLLGILAFWKLMAVLVFKKPWQGGGFVILPGDNSVVLAQCHSGNCSASLVWRAATWL